MNSQNPPFFGEASTSSGTKIHSHPRKIKKDSQDKVKVTLTRKRNFSQISENSSQEKNFDLKSNISLLNSDMRSITLPKFITRTLIRPNLFLVRPPPALVGLQIINLSSAIQPTQEQNKYSHSHFTKYQQVSMPVQNSSAVPVTQQTASRIHTAFIELYKFRNLCSSIAGLMKSFPLHDLKNREEVRLDFEKKIKELFSTLPDTGAFAGMMDYIMMGCPSIEHLGVLFPSKVFLFKIKQYIHFCCDLFYQTKINIGRFLLTLMNMRAPDNRTAKDFFIYDCLSLNLKLIAVENTIIPPQFQLDPYFIHIVD